MVIYAGNSRSYLGKPLIIVPDSFPGLLSYLHESGFIFLIRDSDTMSFYEKADQRLPAVHGVFIQLAKPSVCIPFQTLRERSRVNPIVRGI